MFLNSVRNRLVFLFFAITAAAIGFIYLYVVPQLRSSLTAEKLSRLEEVGTEQTQRIAAAMDRGDSEGRVRRVLRAVAQETDARVTVLGVRQTPSGPQPDFVIGDSEFERTAILPSYPAAGAAASSGSVSTAVETVGGERIGEAAVPHAQRGQTRWVSVLSVPLADVDDNVALIKRQILIAGMIALAAALAAGWFAARAHARRLGRLEAAAEKVAQGDFSSPIPAEGQDEVGQLARTFHEMQERLARLDSARREFIANASHELRTPIFSLGGFMELLEDEDPDPVSRAEFVRTMREQVDRLTKLTQDLLDLSRLDADAIKIKPEVVDLGQLVTRVAGEFELTAEGHRSALEVNGGHAVAVADEDRVAQILRILVDNALTHTPEGTSIAITVERQDGAASVVVRDNGPGIDPHSRGRVFERFYTGDRVRGSGLGLAIARELARLMKGELELASHRGRTEFTLRLPADVESPAPGVGA
jgi:two-component system OmpR family sensor kinase